MSSSDSDLTDVYEKPVEEPPSKRPRRGAGVPRRLPTYRIPRSKFQNALALLQLPRARPARQPRESRINEACMKTEADRALKKRKFRVSVLPDGRTFAGDRVMRRCQRIHQWAVHNALDDAKLDDYQSVDMSAMLSTISACITHEDWRHAVELIAVAATRTQFHWSRLVLFRLALTTLSHDPCLHETGLLESFVQGVLDCRDDDEIRHFLQMCSQIPANIAAGDLSRAELRRLNADKRRVGTLDDSAMDQTKQEPDSSSSASDPDDAENGDKADAYFTKVKSSCSEEESDDGSNNGGEAAANDTRMTEKSSADEQQDKEVSDTNMTSASSADEKEETQKDEEASGRDCGANDTKLRSFSHSSADEDEAKLVSSSSADEQEHKAKEDEVEEDSSDQHVVRYETRNADDTAASEESNKIE